MRTFAIGDIHGCSVALATLLKQMRLEPGDRLVFLGDYIDRGVNSRGVIDRVIELESAYEVIPLLGNHEYMLLQSLECGEPSAFWVDYCGGGETLKSYGGRLAGIPSEHVDFFWRCRKFFESDTHLYVHANYEPDQPLDAQIPEILLWQHLSQSIPRPHQSGKTAIVGHTAQRSGKILNLGHLLCIDTACFAGGWLTSLEIESGEIWQVNKFGDVRQSNLANIPPTTDPYA